MEAPIGEGSSPNVCCSIGPLTRATNPLHSIHPSRPGEFGLSALSAPGNITSSLGGSVRYGYCVNAGTAHQLIRDPSGLRVNLGKQARYSIVGAGYGKGIQYGLPRKCWRTSPIQNGVAMTR